MINPLKNVEINHFLLRHPDVPDELAGFHIAQISDIHMGRWVKPRHVEQLVEFVNDADVDLAALTGDYIGYNEDDIPLCADALSGLEPPSFAVLGNHDHWEDGERTINALEETGIPVLTNRSVTLPGLDDALVVVGVDDEVTDHADVEAAFRNIDPDETPRRFCLTLNHVPSIAGDCARAGAHLILSGHTHGFQFNIPGLTHRIAEGFGTDYYAGPYRIENAYLYINRGLGSASWPWRIRARPELAFFKLRPSNELHLELLDTEMFHVEH